MQAQAIQPALLILSPHLDDAVLACGELIGANPGAHVMTLFAGTGRDPARSTDWDAACGFKSAGESLAARRLEDDAALELLGATPWRLDFADDQYRRSNETVDVDDLPAAIQQALIRFNPAVVVIPMGLFHRDHVLAHEAALPLLRSEARRRRWLAYEDAFYRRIPGLLQQRLFALANAGFLATPVRPAESGGEIAIKRRAVQCYASQLRGLRSPGRPGHLDALAPEGYWKLELPAGTPAASTA